MLAEITLNNTTKKIDLSKPIDISIEVGSNNNPPSAWYLDPLTITPVINEQFKGSVALGGSVNFNTIYFNPHAHTTHTESVGHISKELISINDVLKTFHFEAQLITVKSTTLNSDTNEFMFKGDQIIEKSEFENKIIEGKKALIIRTLPNKSNKLHKKYSNTNWPYLTEEAASYIASKGIEHLLIDLPSIDREEDGGKLLSHHAFWKYPRNTRKQATITELIFVPDNVKDGEYLLNLQIASFINDASPSKPVLYRYI